MSLLWEITWKSVGRLPTIHTKYLLTKRFLLWCLCSCKMALKLLRMPEWITDMINGNEMFWKQIHEESFNAEIMERLPGKGKAEARSVITKRLHQNAKSTLDDSPSIKFCNLSNDLCIIVLLSNLPGNFEKSYWCVCWQSSTGFAIHEGSISNYSKTSFFLQRCGKCAYVKAQKANSMLSSDEISIHFQDFRHVKCFVRGLRKAFVTKFLDGNVAKSV